MVGSAGRRRNLTVKNRDLLRLHKLALLQQVGCELVDDAPTEKRFRCAGKIGAFPHEQAVFLLFIANADAADDQFRVCVVKRFAHILRTCVISGVLPVKRRYVSGRMAFGVKRFLQSAENKAFR